MSEEKIIVKVQMGVLKPVHEVFEAIVDPEKMNKYFISASSGRVESGKILTWTWADYDAELQVKVGKVENDKTISFMWAGSGIECEVDITFEPKGDNHTLIKITESDWPADFKGVNQCMGQVEGWTHFLCCLKGYLEYGINLRIGGLIK